MTLPILHIVSPPQTSGWQQESSRDNEPSPIGGPGRTSTPKDVSDLKAKSDFNFQADQDPPRTPDEHGEDD